MLVAGFDAFGDDPRLGAEGDVADRTYELLFDRVLVDALEEVAVYLDVVRAQLGPQTQAGITGAEVVDGEMKAVAALSGGGLNHAGDVVDGVLLGDLDDDAFGVQYEFAALL